MGSRNGSTMASRLFISVLATRYTTTSWAVLYYNRGYMCMCICLLMYVCLYAYVCVYVCVSEGCPPTLNDVISSSLNGIDRTSSSADCAVPKMQSAGPVGIY